MHPILNILMLRNKLKEWFKRYSLAEFIALIIAIIVANLSKFWFGNIILSAFLATWAENIAYYGTIASKDLKSEINKNEKLSFKAIIKTARNMFIEFGPAEYLDSFLIRPFYLTIFPYLISNYSLAILIGTILANITYYIPTIFSYEMRKKIFKD